MKLYPRTVRVDNQTRSIKVDHSMGRDFAKRAYLLTADDSTGVALRIAFWGNSAATAKKDVLAAGFTNVRDISEHEVIGVIAP